MQQPWYTAAAAVACAAALLSLPSWASGGTFTYEDPNRLWSGVCAAGKAQSPVSVPSVAVTSSLRGLQFSGDCRLDLAALVITEVGGHTMQLQQPGLDCRVRNPAPGDEEADVYSFLQLHLHVQSEHAVGLLRAPLEAHAVFQSDGGKLLVIGIMMAASPTVGAPSGTRGTSATRLRLSAALEAIANGNGSAQALSGLPITALVAVPSADRPLDGGALGPSLAKTGYYTYPGSLTTPPCTEGVRWVVIADVLEVATDVPGAFVSHMRAATSGAWFGNARPVQPLYARSVQRFALQADGDAGAAFFPSAAAPLYPTTCVVALIALAIWAIK